MRLFRRFLQECLAVPPADITFRLHVYTGNGFALGEIEKRWLSALELPRSGLRSHSVDKRPAPTSGTKRNKLPFGVGTLRVMRSTCIVQHMYGAIQEYGGFDEPAWLD